MFNYISILFLCVKLLYAYLFFRVERMAPTSGLSVETMAQLRLDKQPQTN